MTPSIKLLVRRVQDTETALYTIAVALDNLPQVEEKFLLLKMLCISDTGPRDMSKI